MENAQSIKPEVLLQTSLSYKESNRTKQLMQAPQGKSSEMIWNYKMKATDSQVVVSLSIQHESHYTGVEVNVLAQQNTKHSGHF